VSGASVLMSRLKKERVDGTDESSTDYQNYRSCGRW
jgi:hypothetical protein